jgi:hypothetical protein
MRRGMTKEQAVDCFFDRMSIDASNVDAYERVLLLPFAVMRPVVEALCSGELTLADLDGRLFALERSLSPLAELSDVDVAVLVREALCLGAAEA